MAKRHPGYDESVFINCPFDPDYEDLFKAIVFTVFDCGFVPRCSLEIQDSSEIRITKLYTLMASCRYGVHDISMVDLDASTNLPRFNMPLELGIFLSAKRFGDRTQKRKNCLILERRPHQYEKYLSDIKGQDVEAHRNQPARLVRLVRDWLRNSSRRSTIPGGTVIWDRYKVFKRQLPAICAKARLDPDNLTFADYSQLVSEWIRQFP